MKMFITWLVISTAIIISIIEAIHGNAARIIIYIGILIFMWIADKIQKKGNKES